MSLFYVKTPLLVIEKNRQNNAVLSLMELSGIFKFRNLELRVIAPQPPCAQSNIALSSNFRILEQF